MRRARVYLTAVAFLLLLISTATAHSVGVNGQVFPIAEPDAYEELMEKVRKINWEQIKKRYKETVRQSLEVDFSVGKSIEDRVFTVDLTYTLPYDIVTEEGKILYPKGFKFNPLDYIDFPYQIVFFNANSKVEIDWIKKQTWFNKPNVFYIIVKGDVIKAEKLLNKVVFAANARMIERFNISRTPSILTVQGKQLLIKEIGVYKNEH